MTIKVEVAIGELLDKMTILEIKSEKIKDADKLKNVHKELETLKATWDASCYTSHDISGPMKQLKSVNEALWDIEDRIRLKESQQAFDNEFIELARSVYQTNDRRCAIKRELNELLGSGLIEEKSYVHYSQQ